MLALSRLDELIGPLRLTGSLMPPHARQRFEHRQIPDRLARRPFPRNRIRRIQAAQRPDHIRRRHKPRLRRVIPQAVFVLVVQQPLRGPLNAWIVDAVTRRFERDQRHCCWRGVTRLIEAFPGLAVIRRSSQIESPAAILLLQSGETRKVRLHLRCELRVKLPRLRQRGRPNP